MAGLASLLSRRTMNPRAAGAAAMRRNAPIRRPTIGRRPKSYLPRPRGWQAGGAVGGTVPQDVRDWLGGCPSPKEHIQLANNDWILAGELKVGDEVMTSEEPQKVTRVQRLENRPRCEVLFEDSDSIVTSYSHPYFVNSKGFVEVGDLEKGDVIGDLVVKDKKPFAMGPVISLSVDKAETYMLQGGTKENPVPALSHNKTPVQPPPPPRDPDRPIKYYGGDKYGTQFFLEQEARRKAAARAQAAAARTGIQARRQGLRSPGGWQEGGPVGAAPEEVAMASEIFARATPEQQAQITGGGGGPGMMDEEAAIGEALAMAMGGGGPPMGGGGPPMNGAPPMGGLI